MSILPSDRVLDQLRMVGEADSVQGWIGTNTDKVSGYLGLPPGNNTYDVGAPEDLLAEYWELLLAKYRDSGRSRFFLKPDDQLDADKISRASTLFSRYGTEIGAALLLAALPEAYAASYGSLVLYEVSQLTRAPGDFLTRRIAATAQFLVNVIVASQCAVSPGSGGAVASPARQIADGLWGDGPRGRALENTLVLRMRHDLVRHLADEKRKQLLEDFPEKRRDDLVLNQEDLLGTLLTFSVTVFEVLEQFGITWSSDDQEAYRYAWDVVGHYLGIGDPLVIASVRDSSREKGGASEEDRAFLDSAAQRGSLRPQTVPDARVLLDRIRNRVWSAFGDPTQSFDFDKKIQDVRSGRLLLRALVDDVRSAMPSDRQLWPIRVIRQLVPTTVQDRLALGAIPGGDLVASTLPSPRAVVGRFTSVDRRNPVSGLMLRRMATDVANRYFTKLIKGGLTIPGLEFDRES